MRIAIAALAFVAAPASVLAQATAAPPPACDTAAHRQFDFWVGKWDVYPTGKDTLVAHSLIEKLYGGCAVRENWMPLKGGGGGSLNSWRPDEGKWRQTWTDAQGSWTEFSGGVDGEAMVLTAPSTDAAGKPQLQRMRYTRGADGSVRQLGTQSDDGGRSWQPSYDFTYRPAK